MLLFVALFVESYSTYKFIPTRFLILRFFFSHMGQNLKGDIDIRQSSKSEDLIAMSGQRSGN